jgi:transposase InsO family protein
MSNQVWCAELTYIPMRRGFLYLVAVMNWATRKVLAWRMSNTMDVDSAWTPWRRLSPGMGGRRASTATEAASSLHRDSPACCNALDAYFHGWTEALDGRCLHRAALAQPEV